MVRYCVTTIRRLQAVNELFIGMKQFRRFGLILRGSDDIINSSEFRTRDIQAGDSRNVIIYSSRNIRTIARFKKCIISVIGQEER
jgi:predicted RNA-binding protein (virulence factor B family)